MKRIVELSALGAIFLLGSCRAPAPALPPGDPVLARSFPDGTPDYVPAGALDSVVLLQSPDRLRLASGVAVSERHLMTAAHVADGLEGPDGVVSLRIDGDLADARIVARGSKDDPHGDWAVLELPRRMWPSFATVHAPALDPGWAPEAGTEVLLVGYAAGFYRPTAGAPPDARPPVVDVDAPTPAILVRMRNALPERWALEGEPVDVGGMSGGAAMVWNGARGRAELVGVFVSYSFVDLDTTTETSVWGVVLSRDVERERRVDYNVVRLPAEALAPVLRGT